MIRLRAYRESDAETLANLFYETVHSACAKDYTQQQLFAWAPKKGGKAALRGKLSQGETLIAEENGETVGFACIIGGYFDMLYVRNDKLGLGVATRLLQALETDALAKGITHFTVYASVTAKGFFEKSGYRVIRENTVVRKGVTLNNYYMDKFAQERSAPNL